MEARDHDGQIVECTWDFDERTWVFHRERTDKTTPNGWRVYESVRPRCPCLCIPPLECILNGWFLER